MSSVTQSGTRSSGRLVGGVVVAIVGILLVIVGIIYLTTAAGSLPSFIPGHLAGSTGHHPLRAGGTIVIGLILLVLAWWAGFRKPSSAPSAGN